jgi:hypothetical protein
MSYQSDIFDAIKADAPLTALIGSRFFWDIADGDALPPFVVASVITTTGETAFDGTRNVIFPLVQFIAWGTGKAQIIGVIRQLRLAIEGKNLPGASNVSLGFTNENSSFDEETGFFGELIEYRASSNTN